MKIAVIDTETTSLDCNDGHVVEIGCAILDTRTGKVTKEFEHLVHWPIKVLSPEERTAWVFDNTSIRLEDITDKNTDFCLPDFARRIRRFLHTHHVTAYNVAFDFGFLSKDPWNFDGKPFPCVMEKASEYLNFGNKWLKLEEAYRTLCPEDPAQIPVQTHRAGDDAVIAAHVLRELIERGAYDTEKALLDSASGGYVL